MRWIVSGLVSMLAAGSLHAQGVSIHSHGACPLARNSAGVAEPCADGSAVFYNPAALASQRSVASAGVVALYSTATFTFDDTSDSFDSEQGTKLAPHAWLAAGLTRTIAAGIGFWAPYGLSTKWPLDFEGRYIGYDNTLRAIYIQPTIAARLMGNRLAFGAGVAAVNGSVMIRQRTDLARTTIPSTNLQFNAIGVPDGTDFADAELDVNGWAATFHVGVQFRPSERWSLGARYLHTTQLELSGDARFTQTQTGFMLPAGNPFGLPAGAPIDAVLAPQFEPGAPLEDQRLSTELSLPNQFAVGMSYAVTALARLFFDYQWTGWNQFDQAVLDFDTAPTDTLFLDFEDASTFRLAAEFAPRDQLTVRAGVLYNTAAAPDVTVTPLLPEAQRTSFAGGIGYRLSDRLTADAGIEVLVQSDRRGSVRPRNSRAETAADLNAGPYEAHGVFGGITISYFIGPER
ncbi:MAG TPA: outer membrane protein transport protein [Longimicrobiales bacterium]|nr:outer membrane protein transport protein [Longimicrobiales bacterium]